MPLSLNNSKDLVANSVRIIKGNKTIDVLETIDAIQGLAQDTLNSLEKLATALNGDASYFNTVITALSNKADVSTTYTKTDTNTLLDAKLDDIEMTNYATKADTFTKNEVDDKFTNIINGAPGALNTLKELSDALGAGQNFSATVTNTLGLKANASDVTTSLALEKKATDVTTSLALKANASDVTTSLALKANASDVTTSLALKQMLLMLQLH
jgi:hypothetical protein